MLTALQLPEATVVRSVHIGELRTLHGAGVMEYAEGYPVAPRAGTATTVTVDTQRLGILDNTVIYVGPTTDGGRADGTVIEGLVIDDAFNSWYGIWMTRTQRITVRDTVVQHVNFGAMNASECSGRIVANVVHDGTPGLVVAAGTQSSPSKLYIAGNSATANYEGVGVFGDSIATEHLDMGANPLEVLPYRQDHQRRRQRERDEARRSDLLVRDRRRERKWPEQREVETRPVEAFEPDL